MKLWFEKHKNKTLVIISLITVMVVILAVPLFSIIITSRRLIYKSVDDVQPVDIAIVFGTRIVGNTFPSWMLQDRLDTVTKLYKEGKVKKILVSGDNRFDNYNEPDVMKRYLINTGAVKAEDIVTDYAGRRTYDTCIRAKTIFGVDDAILVTQGFHLPRAIYLCQNVGIKSVGISATRPAGYITESIFKFREVLAIYKAMIDVNIKTPNYVGGDKIDIWGPPINRCENLTEDECVEDKGCLPAYGSSFCTGKVCTADRKFLSCKEMKND